MNNECLPKGKFFQGIVCLLAFTAASLFLNEADAQTYYSRGSGNWGTSGTWSTTSHIGASCSCTPTAAGNVRIGSNHTITLQSGGTTTVASITVNDDGLAGTLNFGDAALATTLTVSGDITVTTGIATGTFRSGNTGSAAHTINLGGNLINNGGTVDFTANSATGHTLAFTGAAASTIRGTTSTTTLYNMTLTGTGAISFGDNSALTTRTLNVVNDVTINTGSTFQSGNTGTNSHTWVISGNIINNGTINMNASTPTNQSVTFNSASAKNIRGTGTTITVYNMNVNGAGALTFGDNTATVRTLNVASDLTIGPSGIFQSGNTANVSHTLAIVGSLINNGSIDMTANSATNHTASFTPAPAASESIKGSGTSITFYNMTVGGVASTNLSFGDNAASRTLSIVNDLTIGSTATFQSGSTGAVAQTIQMSGNLIDNGTFNLTANSATNQSATFTPSATKTIKGSATTMSFYYMNVNGAGILNFGDNANARTINIANDLTIGSSGILQSGSTAGQAHTLQMSGNLINDGAIDMTVNSAANHIATFNATTAKSIRGAGTTTTFNTMNVSGTAALTFGDNTATSRTLEVDGDLTVASGATFQSGATGTVLQTLLLTGNLVDNGTVNMAANSATNQTITFNASTPKAIRGTATTITFYDMNVSGTGALTFADNTATARTLKITDDLAIAASSSFQSGASTTVAQVIQIGGDVTNGGTFDLTANSATNQSLTFIGSTNEAVSGSGTFTFRNVAMNTTGSSNVNLASSFLINGTLNFAANGLLTLDANSNITLGSAATITGFSSSKYIQVSGGTGANSNLIKTSAGTTASWQITYPIGTATGGYTPLNLPTVGGTAPTTGGTISVTAIFNASIQGQLRRTFRIVVNGNVAATTFTSPQFNYNTTSDVSGGDALSNYATIWYLSKAVGTWTMVTGTAPGAGMFTFTTPPNNLVTGTYYYTIGASDAYPNTWYSYQSGVWSDWQNWTLDPSGTTLVNGLNLPPQPGDEIVILNGLSITNDVSGQVVSNTTIQSGATLDLVATTGNTLGNVGGSGLLRLQGVNLPSGTYTNFVLATGGTIEYYNTGGTLSNTQVIYNKLIFSNSSTTTDATFITASALTINGTLNITQTGAGHTVTWQINDNSNISRTMTIAGDLTVSSGGKITVGTGNSTSGTQHSLTLSGNFVNNGVVRFFDPTDATYSEANYNYNFTTDALPLTPLIAATVYTKGLRGNAVNVTFSGAADNTVSCNGQTDFYRFILNKGTGQQALLTLNSTAISNMRLFGPANLNGLTPGNSNNALSLQNGTLQLTGTLTIPLLCADGAGAAGNDYTIIPAGAGLWINSPNVTVAVADKDTGNDDQRILCNGLLRISSGKYYGGLSRGLGSGTGGTLLVEGGLVSIWQYRPLSGSTNVSYIQSGGTVDIGTTGYNSTTITSGVNDATVAAYARFSIPSATSTFQMSGGTLNIGTPSQNSTTSGAEAIDIQSSSGSYNVTGGTVNVYIPNSGTYNMGINTTAPLNNLNIYREGTSVSLTSTIKQSTTILSNLTLKTGNAPTLNCGGQNLTVGGDIDVQTGAILLTGSNTITLNGSAAQAWNNNGTINQTTAAANPALMGSIVVNKSAGTVTLGGSYTFPGSSTVTTGTIAGVTLTSGTLNDGGKTLTVITTLSNSATHTGTGSIIVSGPNAIGGSNGTFGNLTISTAGAVATSGDQTVTGNLRLTAATSTLNIQSNSLTVSGGIYDALTGTTVAGFGATKRVQTAGLRNDAGLTRKASSTIDLFFPVGVTTTTAYTPATVNVTASTSGTITMRPVTGAHPTATPANQALLFYWRVTSTGFVGVSAVTHKLYTFNSATLLQGTTGSYKPARYDATTFTWTLGTTYNAASTTIIAQPAANTFSFGTNIDGEYTAGNINAGTIAVFYSRQTGPWNDNNTWSVSPCSSAGVCGAAVTAGAFPTSTSAVVIGDLNNAHSVTIDLSGRTCGTLYIENTSTLDCSTFTSLNFGINTSQTVNGRGKLRIAAVTGGIGVFPGGDFTNFIGPTGGTIEWYGATKTLPTTGPGGLVLDNYYNLIINPNSAQTITLPPSNLTIYNNITMSGAGIAATDASAAVTRTITLNGAFNITAGTFNILTNGGNTAISNFVQTGDLIIGATGKLAVSGGTATHLYTMSGTITNNGILDFLNGSKVNLTFGGTANTSLSGSGTQTRLNFVTVNKGTSQAPTVTFDVAGASMSTPATGWLTLTNGTINFNNSATYVLNTGASTYSIPSTTKLKAQLSTVTIVNNNADAADVLLNGAIEVAGGTVNIGISTNTKNNDIEYASAGSPTIIVSSGNLFVNGAIRRPTLTLSGALIYNQSGGIVTIGGINCTIAPNNTRAVFEIENNTGSSFTFSGGTLNVQRSTTGSTFADLYINPETSAVSTGSLIQFGMGANTTVSTTLSINIVPTIGNLTLLGTTTAQAVNMRSSSLTTSGTLTINTNSTLNTNTLDVNIGGDLTISGTYNGTISGGNTTTFDGSSAQTGQLTSGSTFQNITIDKPAGTATLTGTTTINNLNILNGILSVSGTLKINGDITNNSTQIGAGIISFEGTGTTTAHTINSNGGSFTNLSIGGTETTKKITLNGNVTMNGIVDFGTGGTSRYLFIGSNQLTFSQTGSVNAAHIGSTRFIRTNGVSSDLGVVRNWTTGSNQSFTYPVGTRTNYTPVSYTLNVSNAGDITIIPVDDQHPTANATGQQILNYYWIVKRSSSLGLTNSTGTQSYQFPTSLIGGTGGTAIAAHLDAINLIGWTASPGNGGAVNSNSPSAGNTTLSFTNLLNTNFPAVNGEFHYTEGTTNTLPNPVTPVYSRFADADGISNSTGVGNSAIGGNWNLATNWTLSSTGNGTALSTVPVGRPIVILPGARMNMNIAGLSAFTSQINGVMVIVNTTGHNLGSISGTGTLRTSTSTLPAGNYTTFVSAAGGTIEYAAPITMNNRSTYNNLSVTAAGSVSMTNTDLILNGNLTIASGATVDNSSFNRNISIAKDLTNNGTLTIGTGTITFDGTATQTISGTADFYNLTLLKSGNLTLAATATVENQLTLTTGYLISSSANPLVIAPSATVSGGSSSSFVEGPVKRTISSGGTFKYPSGSTLNFQYRPVTLSNTSGTDDWTVKYVGHSPALDSYNYRTFNTTNLGKVSMFEYWDISRASSTSADVTLSYNSGSYIPSIVGVVANLRVAHWDGTQWDLPPGAGSASQSGTTIVGTVSITNVTSFSPFTLGSLDTSSPLPVKWLGFSAERDGNSILLSWKTAVEQNNDHFVIERSDDGLTFNPIGSKLAVGTSNTTQSYQFTDSEVSKSTQYYYRIKQVDVDGTFDYSTVVVVNGIGETGPVTNWVGLPNPVKDSQDFNIELSKNAAIGVDTPVQVQVMTSAGIIVFEGADALEKINASLEGLFHTVSSGIYIIQISDGVNHQLLRVARY